MAVKIHAPPDVHPPLIAVGLFSYQVGGSERVGADVALECMRRGYRVLCFAFYDSDGPIRRELEGQGVECLDMNYLKRLRVVRRFISWRYFVFSGAAKCMRYISTTPLRSFWLLWQLAVLGCPGSS